MICKANMLDVTLLAEIDNAPATCYIHPIDTTNERLTHCKVMMESIVI